MYTKRPISILNKCITHFYNVILSFIYKHQYRKSYSNLKSTFRGDLTSEEVKRYKQKWESLGRVSPVYFRLFSNYIGKDIRIAPEDIVHNVIENILNPIEHRGPYSDKNMYDLLLRNMPNSMAKTYIRRIRGHYYDSDYNSIQLNQTTLDDLNKYSGVVVKVTVDTSSGMGVKLLSNVNGILVDKINNRPLSMPYLEDMGNDFIVQEYMTQSEFMASLNSTSINTLRMCLYRSVKDNKVHVLNTILRIGKNGSLMDNAHQGGACIGVRENGELQNFLIDQYGNKFVKFNGIDFSESSFAVPEWGTILDFAKRVGENIMYHRLLNLDVMIDSQNRPRLIEYNIRSMGVWVFQYAIGPCFGDFTDEIIDYCVENKDKIKSEYLLI